MLRTVLTASAGNSSLNTWIQLPDGPQISLNGIASNPVAFEMTEVPGEGTWVHVTVPLASENVIRQLLPCSIGATANIGGREIQTAMPLFDHVGTTVSLVRFDDDLVAIQAIGLPQGGPGGGVNSTNRVCVLELRVIGTGPGGTVVTVVSADCVDYNDLECAPLCTQSVGSTFTIPGGPEVITGG